MQVSVRKQNESQAVVHTFPLSSIFEASLVERVSRHPKPHTPHPSWKTKTINKPANHRGLRALDGFVKDTSSQHPHGRQFIHL